MKHILHLTEIFDTGGAENMLISLVDNLDKNIYRSTICLLRPGWLKTQLENRGFETVIIPQDRSFDLPWIMRMIRFLKDNSIDVMHTHEFAMNVYGSFLSKLTGIPIVTTVHGKNYYCDKLRRRMAYRFAARNSIMVAVSEDMKRYLVDRVAISSRDIRVVHNGIDLIRYSANKEGHAVRSELGIREEQPVIGTVGNLFAVKGQLYLLRACEIVAREFPDLVLLIAGDGEEKRALENEARRLGIESNVKLLGFQEDVPSLLRAMDLFALPSLSEGLPLSILEALALQLPVVATDVGGVSEIIRDGVTGLLVPPADPERLAEQILLLLRQPEFAESLGKAGRSRVESGFSLGNMIQQYQSLYEECLGSNH